MFISETVYPKTCNQLKADSHQRGFQTLQQRFKSVDLVAFSNRSLQWLWCEQPMSIDVALPKPPKPVGIVVPLRWESGYAVGKKNSWAVGKFGGFLKNPPDGFEDGSLIHSTLYMKVLPAHAVWICLNERIGVAPTAAACCFGVVVRLFAYQLQIRIGLDR